jgi:putative redox protein
MKHNVNTNWKGNMKFDSVVNGHHVIMDAGTAGGGEDQGARPKELMLSALAGCTGMDVVSILKKMRVELDNFNVNIEADMTEEHPKHYTAMHLIYEFTGNDLPMEKLEKAVKLSQDQYCGVSFMYKKSMDITFEIKVIPSI